MVLAKVLNNASHDVPSILAGKFGLKHTGPALEAMSAIAKGKRGGRGERGVRGVDYFMHE